MRRLRRMEDVWNAGLRDAPSLAFAAFLELLHEVNRCVDAPEHPANTPRSAIVNQAMQYLDAHLSEIRSSAELAGALYVRREHLSRQFSTHMGIPLNRYITLKRVSLAKNLLANGVSLIDVCSACGWQDYSYFITVFRREVGMTPMKYAMAHCLQEKNSQK